MKTKSIITEISQEDLVNLLSTASYGSSYIGLDYDVEMYRTFTNVDENDCYEDKMAKLLLAGKHIIISDMYAEDENDFYGSLRHTWDDVNQTMDYIVCLEDIKKGLQNCLDGTFDVNEGCEEEVEYMRKCVEHLMDNDCLDLDLPEAENIIQIIVFNQLIYG